MKYLLFILIDVFVYPFLLIYYIGSQLYDKIKIHTFVVQTKQ